MIYVTGVTGGRTLNLKKAPTYGTSGQEPAIGDLLLVKWVHYGSSTGYTINKNNPTPFLTYQIVTKTGTLGNNNLVVTVDRNFHCNSSLLLADLLRDGMSIPQL